MEAAITERLGPPTGGRRGNEARAFQRLRWRMIRNSTRGRLSGSSLRAITIAFCSALIWGGVYWAAADGFHFFRKHNIFLGGGLVGTLFDLMFLALGVLLIFSSGIILYSSLFSSAESNFLLSLPARADQVFAYKFQGALAFSSWGFVLLGSPVLVAYGVSVGAVWSFYLFIFAFFLGYVLLPGSIGAMCALLLINLVPRRPKQVLAILILAVLCYGGWWARTMAPKNWFNIDTDYEQRLLTQLDMMRGPLAPNHWVSRGLQAAARGEMNLTLYSLALIWSNGLLLYLVAAWISKRVYRYTYNRICTGGTLRKRYGGHWLDHALEGVVGFVNWRTRLLIVKDFRTFRRDPAQWAQVLIFMGLSMLYFINIRRFYQGDFGAQYRNGVSFVNLMATSLLLCAYTGRFIFPMLSLEGRKFWILGLLPLERERLILGKFAFSATWAILISEILVLFSDGMLGVPRLVFALHAVIVAVLAFGFSGLAVGLGATMPDFRQSDPSKIAVGFGGTLNLVVSLLFMVAIIALMAGPVHFRIYVTGEMELGNSRLAMLVGGVAGGLLLGAAAVYLPLRSGVRTLERMEF